jgi:hypothetical protein
MLAKAHGIALDTCKCLHIYNTGVAKNFKIMQQELKYLAIKGAIDVDGDGHVGDAEAWFKALDVNGDSKVDLEELVSGLDVTRILAEARNGGIVNVTGSRWTFALNQVALLTQSCPEFVDGWRLRMILGTICDGYDSIIDSADKIVSLKPGDPQALTLKAFYCQALKRDGYSEAMSALTQSAPKIADMASKLVIGVDKYWDAELTHTVPSGISEKMAILALGSPAEDDGTPRPRLLGTLQKTLEAANMYPDADIFVTGAAVSSNCPEAIAMKKWLQKRGVSNNIIMEMKAMDTVGNYEYIAPILQERQVSKVMLITVYYHLNRSSALADAVFEAKNVNVEVVGVAGESDLKGDALAAQMSVERPASYRDVARARGLYDAISFDQIVA